MARLHWSDAATLAPRHTLRALPLPGPRLWPPLAMRSAHLPWLAATARRHRLFSHGSALLPPLPVTLRHFAAISGSLSDCVALRPAPPALWSGQPGPSTALPACHQPESRSAPPLPTATAPARAPPA